MIGNFNELICILCQKNWIFEKKYANTDRQFFTKPKIDLQHWTIGYHWAKSNKQILSKQLNDNIEYYCLIGEQTKVTEEQIKIDHQMCWNTFAQFKKRASSLWIVNWPNDMSNEKWKEGKCTCPYFLKKYM